MPRKRDEHKLGMKMTTIHIRPDQLLKLRRIAFELGEEFPQLTQSDICRFALDQLFNNWKQNQGKFVEFLSEKYSKKGEV
jgi:hypothetical protein